MKKTQIIEQAQSQLGYLGRNNNIFTGNETRGKWVKYRQTSARSCLSSDLEKLLSVCSEVDIKVMVNVTFTAKK